MSDVFGGTHRLTYADGPNGEKGKYRNGRNGDSSKYSNGYNGLNSDKGIYRQRL